MQDTQKKFDPDSKQLSLLLEIARILTRYAELTDAFGPLVTELVTSTSLSKVCIVYSSDERESARIHALSADEDQELLDTVVYLGEGVLGKALGEGLPHITPEFIFCPILSKDIAIGLIRCATQSEQTNKVILSLLKNIAAMIAEASKLRVSMHKKIEDSLSATQGLARFSLENSPPPVKLATGTQLSIADRIHQVVLGRSPDIIQTHFFIESALHKPGAIMLLGEIGTGKKFIAQVITQFSRGNYDVTLGGGEGQLKKASVLEVVDASTLSIANLHSALQKARERDNVIFITELAHVNSDVQKELLKLLPQLKQYFFVASIYDKTSLVEQGVDATLLTLLAQHCLELAPLRKRTGDVLVLTDYFISFYARIYKRDVVRISTPALDLLRSYYWPHNIEELEHTIEYAVKLSTDKVIHSYQLPPSLQSAQSTDTAIKTTLDESVARLEKELIIEALKLEGGNASAAARRLDVTERRMGLMLRKYGIDWRRFRPH